MRKLLLLCLTGLLTQEYFAQSPCIGTPSPCSVTPATNTVCMNGAVLLSLNVTPSNSGIKYQWQSSTVSSSGPYSNVPNTGTNSTYYTVPITTMSWFQVVIVCTNAGAPTNASPAQVAVTICDGIENLNNYKTGLIFYPNPANQDMTIEMPGEANTAVSVYSIDGRKVAIEGHDLGKDKLELNIGHLETGIYILELSSDNQKTRKVFCVAR